MKIDTLYHKWMRVPYRLHTQLHHRAKRPRASLLFIHGIGTSSSAWDKVIGKLPDDVQVVTVDLLGFGLSPRPTWAVYDAKRQARSVIRSYAKLRLRGPVIVIGHSLGALVAVEVAKLRPKLAKSLLLCSPPFYASVPDQKKLLPNNEMILKNIYRLIQAKPDQFIKISALAAKYGIVNRGFQITDENVFAYMNALEASIVNQTAYDDVRQLRLPISIIYGTLDPVVITKNLRQLDKQMDNVSLKSVVAAHEIKGRYITTVARMIADMLPTAAK